MGVNKAPTCICGHGIRKYEGVRPHALPGTSPRPPGRLLYGRSQIQLGESSCYESITGRTHALWSNGGCEKVGSAGIQILVGGLADTPQQKS